jgi:hypothetical protein
MQKSSNRLFATAALAMSLGPGMPAHAEDWKVVGQFGWFGVGKTYEIERGHVYWVGEFNGTFFNDKGKGSPFDKAAVKCPAYNDIDANLMTPLICQIGPKTSANSGCSCSVREKRCISGRNLASGIVGIRS